MARSLQVACMERPYRLHRVRSPDRQLCRLPRVAVVNEGKSGSERSAQLPVPLQRLDSLVRHDPWPQAIGEHSQH